MTDLLLGSVVALLFAVTVWRSRLAVRTFRVDGVRSWAKVHLAVSMALLTFVVGTELFEPMLAELTDLAGLDATLRQIAVIGVAMSLHSYLITVRREELRARDDGKHMRFRYTLSPGQGTQLAGVVLALVFVMAWLVTLRPQDPVGAQAVVSGLESLAGCFVGWVLLVNVHVAATMWRLEVTLPDSAQDAGRRWMTGLLGLGSAIAGIYAATTIGVGLAQLAGGATWIDGVETFGLRMAVLGIGVLVVGVMVPRFVGEGPSSLQIRKQIRLMTPLWSDLTAAHPAGRLDIESGTNGDQLLARRWRRVQEIASVVNTLDLSSGGSARLVESLAGAKEHGFPTDGSTHQWLVGSNWDDLLSEVTTLAADYAGLTSSSPAGGRP